MALLIGHSYDDPRRTVLAQAVAVKPVPAIVIDVPAGPCAGVMDVTVPMVHGVNRNLRLLDGTDCEHELGLIKELAPHDDAGTEAVHNERESCLHESVKGQASFTCRCAVQTLARVGRCW